MPFSKALNLSVVLLGFLPVLAMASEPSTQPAVQGAPSDTQAAPSPGDVPSVLDSANPTDGPSNTSAGGGGNSGSNSNGPHHPDHGDNGGQIGRGRFTQRFFGPVSPKESADAMIYLKEHSPNRAAAIESLPDGERKNRVLEVAAHNYVSWMRILNQDPELYKVIKSRVEVEDNIFGLVTKLKKLPSNQQDIVQEKLREQVSELVDLGIQERQLRLQRLRETVKQLTAKLTDDSTHRADLVDQRLKTILNDGKSLIPSGGSGNGGGGGGAGPGR